MIVQCAWCGKMFDKSIKRINQSNKLGQQHTCSRQCSSKLVNEERRSAPATLNAEKTRKDKEKFPEKSHARLLVRHAIRSGKLIPPEECEICQSPTNVQGHHPDYTRPFLLIYLCKKCHALADASIDKLEDLATDYASQLRENND